MQTHPAIRCCIAFLMCGTAVRAQTPAVNLEIAAEAKAPFGAQQKWYDALKGLKLGSLRLRQARPREQPRIESGGNERRPTFRVVAILDSRSQLRLPGASFAQRDAARIERYLQTLRDEGVDGVTASRGMFGLTHKQFREALEELSKELGISTNGKRPRELVDALADRFEHRLVVEPRLLPQLDEADPIPVELEGLSRGTTLAILLREAGLAFRPQMHAGELRYRIEALDDESKDPERTRLQISLAGRRNERSDGPRLTHWPVGWEPEASPVRTAPDLFERINAQIGGYSLAEALDAVAPRLKVPLVMDRSRITARKIDPDNLQVELRAGEYSYFRILERILYQAGLKGTICVDERGVPFYWISVISR